MGKITNQESPCIGYRFRTNLLGGNNTLFDGKMKETIGKVHIESTKTRQKSRGRLYIPADLVKDSLFPFDDKDKVKIKIENEKLVVEKVE